MVAVILPSYKVKEWILPVLAGIGPEVSKIYVVDDACPEHSGKWVEDQCRDPRVRVLYHAENQGVGGATMTGFLEAHREGAKVVVKIDGDGQMDPAKIPMLIRPLIEGRADYAKGNRFFAPEFLNSMPALRLWGNAALSFITKISSGYWRIMDPTNGFIALQADLLPLLPAFKVDKTYFFESDMLFRLSTLRAVVVDVPMRCRYGSEISGLRISKVLFSFSLKHLRCFSKRIFYNYFLRDFNLGSVQLVAGIFLPLFGVVFGASAWWENAHAGRTSPVGTVMIATLPILIGIQLLLSAINYDILNEPRTPLSGQL